MSQAEFAKQIGRSGATVSRIISGQDRPSWATLDAIVAATKGKVTADDFVRCAGEKPE